MNQFIWRSGLLGLALMVFSSNAFAANDYYFSVSDGHDISGNGSLANPWASISKLNSLTLNAGDTVRLKGGDTFSGNIYLDPLDTGTNASGALVSPISLTSYAAGRATISASNSFGLYAYNNGGINISNLNFVGSGVAANGTTTNTSDGIAFYTDKAGGIKQNHIYIDNVEVSGFGGKGISIGGFNGTTAYNDVRVADTSTHDNLKAGLITYAQNWGANTNVTVSGVAAWNNFGDPASAGNTGSGIVLGNVNGATIERSVAHNNGQNNNPTEGPVGIWTYDSNNVSIQFNESYANRTNNGDGGGFDLDQNVTNSVMQYNYSHDNAGAGYLLYDGDGTTRFNSGNVVRYNISQNDGRRGDTAVGGINIGGNVKNLDVYQNTIFITKTSSGAIVPAINIAKYGAATSPTAIRILNNIFYTDNGGRLVLKNSNVTGVITFLNNDYYSADGAFNVSWNGTTYTTLAAWLAAVTTQERYDKDGNGIAEIVAFNVDPKLVLAGGGGTFGDADMLALLNAYRLQANSPLINGGLNLQAAFGIVPGTHDFFLIPIPQGVAFDIGASEVPEPTMLALLAAGAAIFAFRRRRAA